MTPCAETPPRGQNRPIQRLSPRAVRRLLMRILPDYDFDRMDPRLRRSAIAVARHRIQLTQLLERVEMDSMHLPQVCVSPGGLLEDLWLTHAICCTSSMPMGWVLSATRPTVDTTLRCLRFIATPKRDQMLLHGIDDLPIDPWGWMTQLVLDNGSENIGVSIDRLSMLGLDVNHCAVHAAHQKPFIERLNKSLKTALEILPGCTRFDGKDGARTAQARQDKNLLTMQQLEHWIVRFFYQEWIHRPLARLIESDAQCDESLGVRPIERWQRLKEQQIPLMPPSPEEWLRVMWIDDSRKISRTTGISFQGFEFRGEGLAAALKEYRDSETVPIRYNPNDHRWIYVVARDGVTHHTLVNGEINEHTPAFSFAEASKRSREARRVMNEVTPEQQRFRDDILELSAQKKRRTPRQAAKEAQDVMRIRQAHERARAVPVPGASVDPSAWGSGDALTQDSIPDLDASSLDRR